MDDMEIDLKKIGKFLKSVQGAEYLYMRQLMGMRESIQRLLFQYGLTKDDICEAFKVSSRKYEDFCFGNYDYSLMDIARIDSIIREKEIAKLEKESIVEFPAYRYSEMKIGKSEGEEPPK